MPSVGDPAPEFDAPTSLGDRLKLSSLRGHSVVLYFYPAADTPGCTVESKGFRDMNAQLHQKNVKVVGVSVDSVKDQCDFAEKYGFPFPLVADTEKTIATSYGVLGPRGTARRVTFFIGPDGKVVEVVDDRSADTHLARAKARFLTT